ncbi:MAG: NAD(P)H-hydrate dehydratase [Pseudomonadota bacterium]
MNLTPDIIASLAKSEHQHKYDHGHALVLSGGMGKGGAARLAARGALRVGAGLVTVGCPPSALLEHATQLTAIMCRPVADASALTDMLKDHRFNALCIGPGLGLGDDAQSLVAAVLESRRATVLDADALTLLSGDRALVAMLHQGCILTPHGGEFARLFPDTDLADREAATRAAAASAGCTVLLKGAETVIATPGGATITRQARGAEAAPWLATAGSGDVLAGIITGLLARGLSVQDAAATGVWLHAEAARVFGPGLIAEDLPDALPLVFRKIGL